MICNNCGLTLKNAAKFCAGCGIAIGDKAVETSPYGESAPPTPVSTLFADSQQQSSSMVGCVIHTSTTARGTCVDCGNFFCRDCMVNIAGRNYCRGCAARLRAPQPTSPPAHNYQAMSPSPWTTQPYHYSQPAPTYQYQPQVNSYVQPAPMYVKRKEPVVALLLSFLLPGLGQFYNGDVGKGIGLMLGFWCWYGSE